MNPANVLVVEDNAVHARVLISHLRHACPSMNLDCVKDGDEALLYVRRQGSYANRPRPSLILLDLQMPRMDGHEVLQFLKGDAEYRCIPVVVLSTSNERSDQHRAYLAGANGYTVKPDEPEGWRRLAHHLAGYWLQCNTRCCG